MKEYPCMLSKTKVCRYGGNKYFNYGFLRGSAEYCRKTKQWIHNLKKCDFHKEAL